MNIFNDITLALILVATGNEALALIKSGQPITSAGLLSLAMPVLLSLQLADPQLTVDPVLVQKIADAVATAVTDYYTPKAA